MNSGIYTITNLFNNKMYVGMSKNIKNRLCHHKAELRGNYHINEFLQKSWNKYGAENFLFEVLEECEEQFLCSQEHYWCNMLNTHDMKYGYNLLPTHPYCLNLSSKFIREKISKKLTGRKLSEEHKLKIKYNSLGKKHTEKSKKLISINNLGKKRTDLTKKKISENHKALHKAGKFKTRGISLQANTTNSITWRNKYDNGYISKTNKSIIQYDLDNNFIKEWISVTEASKILNIPRTSISACLRKYTKKCHNFKWEYKNKENKKQTYKLINLGTKYD